MVTRSLKSADAMILRLVGGARERRAIASGQVDAVIDPGTRRAILLPDAQASLIAHEARLHGLMELASDGYWEQDEHFRFTLHTGVAICGEPGVLGVLGKRLWDLPLDNGSEIDWQAHRAQLEWCSVFRDLELRFVDRAGRLRNIIISGEPMSDPHGQFKGYCGITKDITQFLQRRRGEEALRRSEARFRSLVEISADWYWEQDRNFRFTSLVGAGMACMKGLLGKALWEVPEIIPEGEDWATHQSELAACWSFCDFQCTVEPPGGPLAYYLVSGAPVYDEKGTFSGFQGTGLDITRHRQAGVAARLGGP